MERGTALGRNHPALEASAEEGREDCTSTHADTQSGPETRGAGANPAPAGRSGPSGALGPSPEDGEGFPAPLGFVKPTVARLPAHSRGRRQSRQAHSNKDTLTEHARGGSHEEKRPGSRWGRAEALVERNGEASPPCWLPGPP